MSTPIAEISIFDENNKRAVINLVPEQLRNRILSTYNKFPEMFTQDEDELKKIMVKRGNVKHLMKAVDYKIRENFWSEYTKTQVMSNGSYVKLNMDIILGNRMSLDYFCARHLAKAERVAWLMCPPTEYGEQLAEVHAHALDEIREILQLPISKTVMGKGGPKTVVDIRIAELKAKIFVQLDMRMKGGYTQRLESKEARLNITMKAGENGQITPESIEDIDKKLAELEMENGVASVKYTEETRGSPKSSNDKPIIEVESHVVK